MHLKLAISSDLRFFNGFKCWWLDGITELTKSHIQHKTPPSSYNYRRTIAVHCVRVQPPLVFSHFLLFINFVEHFVIQTGFIWWFIQPKQTQAPCFTLGMQLVKYVAVLFFCESFFNGKQQMFVSENSDRVTPGAFALVLNCTCCYLTLADQL